MSRQGQLSSVGIEPEHPHDSRRDRSVATATRLRLPCVTSVVAETWCAWRTSRQMLKWYQRVSDEQPQLKGTTLYQEIIVRRSAFSVETARGVLQRARQSFCEWPGRRELQFRDVVNYLVMQEYMQSHLTQVGTYSDTKRVVSSVIPSHL